MNRYSAQLSGPVKAASILPADSNRMRQDVLCNPQEVAKKRIELWGAMLAFETPLTVPCGVDGGCCGGTGVGTLLAAPWEVHWRTLTAAIGE